MEFIEYPDRELMFLGLADKLAAQLGDFLRRQDNATFCVPGGTTPGPIFDVLSDVDLDWSRVRVLLNDERWVPEEAGRSNARLVRKRLLTGRAAAAEFVPLYEDAETPEEKLDEVTARVMPCLPISVLLLGMGGDMHTASLFPGANGLRQALKHSAPPLMAMRQPGTGEARITLTAPVLEAAMSTHVVITGPEKRAAVERAQDLDPLDAPIRVVLDEATVHWAE